MHPYLNTAITAARSAGKIITRNMENLEAIRIEEKGVNDFVTLVDRECERTIIDIIRKAYPHHSILGEETGFHEGDDFTWVIDPLDGTLNYVHGFPSFVVSIAAKLKDQIEHAVIYDPITQDLYTASKGRGAQMNAKRIRVSDHNSLAGTLIGSSFPYMDREKNMDMHFNIFKSVFSQCADVRRTGSAALNLALIAAGRLDGVWESGLQPWDMAAGLLLVREAGGYVTDFEGGHGYLENGNIIAGSRKIHAEILKIIQENKWW